MSTDDFMKWMTEQGLTNRFDRQKCLDIFREGWIDEAKERALEMVAANKPKPHKCPLTGIVV